MTEFVIASEAGDLERGWCPLDKSVTSDSIAETKVRQYSGIVRGVSTQAFRSSKWEGESRFDRESPPLSLSLSPGSLGSIIIRCKNNPYFMIQRSDASVSRFDGVIRRPAKTTQRSKREQWCISCSIFFQPFPKRMFRLLFAIIIDGRRELARNLRLIFAMQ